MQNGLWHTPSSALALLFVVPKKEESHNAHAEDQLLMKGQRMRIDEKEQKKEQTNDYGGGKQVKGDRVLPLKLFVHKLPLLPFVLIFEAVQRRIILLLSGGAQKSFSPIQ